MPSSVYTVRAAELAAFTGTVTATVPSGKIWILSHADVVCDSAAGDEIAMNGANGATFFLYKQPAAPAQFYTQWQGRSVFLAGESVSFIVISGVWNLVATAYELTP